MATKVLLLGDSGVGKSSIIQRLDKNKFSDRFLTTIGIDYIKKNFIIDDQKVILQIWDTAGQERFHTITKTYYKGAHGVALVFDLTQEDSFKNINFWIDSVKSEVEKDNINFILIGTKSDLNNLRKINKDEIEKFVTVHNIKYFEISSKTDPLEKIEKCFKYLHKIILPFNKKTVYDNKKSNSIKLTKTTTKDKFKAIFTNCCT